MDKSEIRNKIKQVLIKNFELDEDKIQDDKLLFTDLGLDSLDLVDLIVGLQREFKIDPAQAFGVYDNSHIWRRVQCN